MTFEGPAYGPCEPFTTWDEITACGSAPDVDVSMQDLVVDLATEVVWNLTGRRFSGTCTRTVEPCWPTVCGFEPCCCRRGSRLDLGSVISVEEIVIDGETLDNTAGVAYRVLDNRWVERVDGESWPRCSVVWSVAYSFGTAIPKTARRIASLLGLEWAKQCADLECALDPRTVNFSREGYSVQLAPPDALIEQGFTGIPTVDLLLSSLGRGGQGGAYMFGPRHVEVTWDLADVD